MNLADIPPSLHAIWDDNPSAETREHLVEKIDAFHHRTFPSEFERFTLVLQDNIASLKGGVSGLIYYDRRVGARIDHRLCSCHRRL